MPEVTAPVCRYMLWVVMMRLRISAFLPLLLLLSACSHSGRDALREVKMPSDPYYATLARQYRILADSEAAQGRFTSAQFFADKGLSAAYGRDAPPEIPPPAQKDMADARVRLVAAATPQARKRFPEAVANALFFYECWVQQTGEKQTENAAICRQGFGEAMEATRRPSTAADGVPEDLPLSTSYLIFFGWDKADLNAQAEEAIAKVTAYIEQLHRTGYEIVVNGHTDRSGEETYNLTLSNRRADAVKERLVKAGVAAENITSFGFGESDPRKPTADGVRESANRRVEIFIE